MKLSSRALRLYLMATTSIKNNRPPMLFVPVDKDGNRINGW